MKKKTVLLILYMSISLTVFSQADQPANRVSPKFDALKANPDPSTQNARTRPTSPFRLSTDAYLLTDGYVAVEAVASSSAEAPRLLADLKAMGLQYGSAFGRMVGGLLPLDVVDEETMGQLPSLKYIRPSVSGTRIGSVDSQGDVAQLSDEARAIFREDGTGTKVGILSDSYNTLGGAEGGVASGDLPGVGNPNDYSAPVDVLMELPGTGIDEGRAMAEIVHDVAPGAELAFHTAVISQPSFANAILALADVDSDVIVDDILFFAEPLFQDGIIAQAVDSVFDQGVSYFSSIGNSLDKAYDSDFRDGGTFVLRDTASGDSIGTYVLHDFDAGEGVNTFFPVDFPDLGDRPSFSAAVLSWDEPAASVCSNCPGAETEIDFFFALEDQNGNSVIRSLSSEEVNVGGDPIEVITANTNEPGRAYLLVGKKVAPDGSVSDKPLKIKIVELEDANMPFTTEIGGTGYGHSNANGAVATGAVRYDRTPEFGVDPPLREVFSSSGGVPILFDTQGNRIEPEIRLKPNVSAVQGANNTFFGDDYEGDGLPNFFGTSASAPHAAGVAALMLATTNKEVSPTEIREAMERTALDMEPSREVLPAPPPRADPKFDFDTGHGLLLATDAIASVSPEPSALRLYLVEASTGDVITKINDGDTLDLATLTSTDVSIEAEVAAGKSNLRGVYFRLEGPNDTRFFDTAAPFYIQGDSQGLPRAWDASEYRAGRYQLMALPFSTDRGVGNRLRISFTLTDDEAIAARQAVEEKPTTLRDIGTIRIFPNPTETGKMTYSFGSKQKDTPASLYVYDMTGRLITHQSFQGPFSEQLDLSRQGKGVYLTKLIVGDEQYVERVMVAE